MKMRQFLREAVQWSGNNCWDLCSGPCYLRFLLSQLSLCSNSRVQACVQDVFGDNYQAQLTPLSHPVRVSVLPGE